MGIFYSEAPNFPILKFGSEPNLNAPILESEPNLNAQNLPYP